SLYRTDACKPASAGLFVKHLASPAGPHPPPKKRCCDHCADYGCRCDNEKPYDAKAKVICKLSS
ncbi:hypothetical protein, partial [Pseudomonas syringae group genomosp. 3]|uniref:hypothetical protein n=1 Tax=Pseudomonas syringae group genomosp. 3 TaxID=251701 RepID=UPI001C7FA5E6